MANARTKVCVRPVLMLPTLVQLAPLSFDRNTPPPKVPAKRFVPLMASDWTLLFVKLFGGVPLASVQFVPLSVDKKTPLWPVPTKILLFVPSKTNDWISEVAKVEVQVSPPSIDLNISLNISLAVPAKRFVPNMASDRTVVFVKKSSGGVPLVSVQLNAVYGVVASPAKRPVT